MTNFSQGLWECNFMPEEFRVRSKGCVITTDGKYVASVHNDDDARLIAQAPEMYALLCVLHREGLIPKNIGSYPALEEMQSIIQAVTGIQT